MPNLKQVVEKNNTKPGRIFDIVIQILIVISLITFSIETLPSLSKATRTVLRYTEITIVIIFTIEYLLRILVADNKLRFIFSFFGLIDLFAILPFYIASGIDLRSLRAFRFLRLFRILKLARYSRAIQRFHRAITLAKEEIFLFFCMTVLLLYFSSVGIYYFENEAQPEAFSSVFHCMWWAVCTLSTVGYGDVYPVSRQNIVDRFLLENKRHFLLS